ncbi:hypothetical protein GOBAR_AA06891 [Gossypium barbadense]|uniref:Uncharacterized protein n=1 Tax=Gossypium barbadense TaxID=3634 RepID=A0A2P5YDL3_GOSBA|nr:hypothetical protein GOBAR_AA06891 [Gossypium barbadense]
MEDHRCHAPPPHRWFTDQNQKEKEREKNVDAQQRAKNLEKETIITFESIGWYSCENLGIERRGGVGRW